MPVKVNLGCGPVGKDDWINLDWGVLAFLHRYRFLETILLKLNLLPKGYNVKWPGNLRLHNCRKRLPFSDDSVDYVYTSHFLEHFKRFEARSILAECYRILRKGGVIRVTLPDLEILAKKYLEKDSEYFKSILALMNFGEENPSQEDYPLADIFVDNFYPNFYREKPRGIQKALVGFIRPHLWMYDQDSLASLLTGIGFRNVKRMAFREGNTPDLKHLDVFPEMTLYMEAEK